MLPSPETRGLSTEPGKKIEMYSSAFYAACTGGGILRCGLTHMAVTPLDLVKCNMQIDPTKYKSISSGFEILLKEQGVKGFFKGWAPTLLGYSGQGACKFGGDETVGVTGGGEEPGEVGAGVVGVGAVVVVGEGGMEGAEELEAATEVGIADDDGVKQYRIVF